MIGRISALAVASVLLVASGCGKSASGPLSPARNLAGTWEMDFPVPVYFDTDWCTDTPSLVASQDWNATWVITPGADDNTVNVEMRFSTSNSKVIAGCPGTGGVPVL